MVAITRWVEYDVTAEGTAGVGGTASGTGTQGYIIADSTGSKDAFNVVETSQDKLYINIDGEGGGTTFITLASGTSLDPRFVAKDVTEKIHNLGKGTSKWDQAQCVWENNKLKIYSGSLGSSSVVAVVSGTGTAHVELGFSGSSGVGGSNNNPRGEVNNYNGGITISGTYGGFFDEVYHIVMSNSSAFGTVTKGGANSYTGTMTRGGNFNANQDITYTITIDVTNGTTMGGGAGAVPTMEWTSNGGVDDSGSAIELLYPDYWYKVGTKGMMVKFTDAVFNTCDPAWTAPCTKHLYVQGTNTVANAGLAYYVYGSTRGDWSSTPVQTVNGGFTRLGSRGLYIRFDGDNQFEVMDEYFIVCSAPPPKSYNITNLNYGNVTVSTEAPVKCVLFEIISGAVEISTVKFGLQNHGTFSHHDAGNTDTSFRFGTVGPGDIAGSPTQGGSGDVNGIEWNTGITAADIDDDTPPNYLYATAEDLAVVSDADDSESIGASTYMGMCADPIWLNIKLGASEVGANSNINYRIFFDYS
ncbi:MAG: hypothetical protein DRP42_01525 [Tenericutes bacterium]|nr:MAG: hypothetical protein DRP42_01525 [Mycoplasmatota bacterium]